MKLVDKLNAALVFALFEIKSKYRRSKIGPFWITVSTMLMVVTIGFVYSNIFKSEINVYLPYLAVGIVSWTLISTVLSESCNSYIDSAPLIRQLPISHYIYPLKVLNKNLIIFAHNFIVIPIVLLFFHRLSDLNVVGFLFGVVVLYINLAFISIVLALICSRYRDVSQIISSLLMLFFYFTPIVWYKDLLSQDISWVLYFNPFFYFVDIIRAPLLGNDLSVYTVLFFIIFTPLVAGISVLIYRKYDKRVSYWV